MRILIVVHGYPPTFTGGAELRAERTARGMIARGHDVAVLCVESVSSPDNQPRNHEYMQDGVLVHRLHFGYETGNEHYRQFYDNPHTAHALARIIRFWKPDLVHLFSGYLTGMGVIHTAVEHHVPIVVSLTDYWWLCHRITMIRTDGERCAGPSPAGCARCQNEVYRRYRLPAQVVRPLADAFWNLAAHEPWMRERLGFHEQAERQEALITALANANALISPSRYLAEVYIENGVNRDQVHVLRQGVELNLCPVRERSLSIRFGYFGQIKHHKGIHTLIEAWGKLVSDKPHELAIYGSYRGEEKYGAHLRQMSSLMQNVTWKESVPHVEVWQALANVDVLLIPSRWVENSPNIILEAQAMGVVIIGTNLGGIAELVQHGKNGLLFEADNAEDLAAQMQRLLDNPHLVEEFRRNPIPFTTVQDELRCLEQLYTTHVDKKVDNRANPCDS